MPRWKAQSIHGSGIVIVITGIVIQIPPRHSGHNLSQPSLQPPRKVGSHPLAPTPNTEPEDVVGARRNHLIWLFFSAQIPFGFAGGAFSRHPRGRKRKRISAPTKHQRCDERCDWSMDWSVVSSAMAWRGCDGLAPMTRPLHHGSSAKNDRIRLPISQTLHVHIYIHWGWLIERGS